ncbi:sensor histidine kinase [Xanthocytophaga flava]|uniref:sensor histidine kinase n=1 Tax=Xanthocytophaga flava TaxID=3048013 RepID=UPI0028D752D2|nr:GAF domain-containing sensor histidine kinase [Xanthocytophaga flavus]MDJ1473300.1 GAF domain-containing sensor histidine kinase [Xanthocytophaga flavus]
MIISRNPDQDASLLQTAAAYSSLDISSMDKNFEEILQLVSLICGVPIVLMITIEGEKQWVKAEKGLNLSELPYEIPFCTQLIRQEGLFLTNDIKKEKLLCGNHLLKNDSRICFYADIPLVDSEKHQIGSLCIMDYEEHAIIEEQEMILQVLAGQIVKKLELKQRNESLIALLDQAHEQAQKIYHLHEINSRILSVISHDLRSPLNLISGMLSLLSEEERIEDDLKSIIDKTSRMLYITDQMLTSLVQWGFAQQEGNEVTKVVFTLWELVDKVRQEQLPMAEAKDNQITNRVDKKIQIQADKEMLRFVLRNLVGNANKFTDSGEITIQASQLEAAIQIEVTDTGKGMSQEFMEGVFERHQTSRGTQGEKGLGFGLMMCRAFIEEHKGRLEVKSEMNKGSIFSIFIPQEI